MLELLALGAAALIAGLIAWIVGHFAWRRWRARCRASERAAALAGLRDVALGRASAQDVAARFSALPLREQISLLEQVAPPLGARERHRVSGVADRAGLRARADGWCSGRRWWRRLHGLRVLALIGEAAGAARALLGDPSPDVRAEAALLVAPSATAGDLDELLTMLEDEEPLCRRAAKEALLRAGGVTVEPLAARLPLMEGRSLLDGLDVAASLAGPRLVEPVMQLLGDSDPAVRAGALEVVGRSGGAAAIEWALRLLSDPAPRVRATAARILGRLGYWEATRQLRSLMRDSSWEVRRAAAVALKALGPPGTLTLRRALEDDDRFAADMARQILAIPSGVDREVLA